MFMKVGFVYVLLTTTQLVISDVGFVLASPVLANNAAAQTSSEQGGPKETRWEGRVERSDKDKSTLVVRKSGGNVEKTVVYDSSTKWTSQYHADNQVRDIDPSQVKDGDYVIAKGTYDKKGVLHATLISKRLSHSR